jgi:3-oxoacyl-[acyl-carrier protein] reductase
MDLGIKNKVAVITGGSVGIGFAISKGMAQEGVNLVICARNEERLRGAVNQIKGKFGVKVIGIKADVTKVDDIAALAARIEQEFGGTDILINNAGTGSEEKIMEASDAKWQFYWDLHVMAAVRLSKVLVPFMRRRGGGVIINNASICAKQPLGYEPIYNTTKAALVMFSKCLANEVIGDNIRVNTVNPGLILTPDWWKSADILSKKEGITPEDYLNKIARENVPIGRFASPEELTSFFVFLCSPKASYCVGATYFVDGGWLKVVD